MKRYIFTLIVVMSTIFGAKAMSYEQARQQALYLTDKMAYELNLTDRQWNEAYEINLDYLMGITTPDDLYGPYWRYRNDDLRVILYDWQWTAFAAVDYFFRPISWVSGRWYMPIYTHYDRGFYYYDRPAVYVSYCGGHGRYYHSGGYYAPHHADHWHGGMRCADRVVIDRGHGVRNEAMRGGNRGGNMANADRGGRGDNNGNRGYSFGDNNNHGNSNSNNANGGHNMNGSDRGNRNYGGSSMGSDNNRGGSDNNSSSSVRTVRTDFNSRSNNTVRVQNPQRSFDRSSSRITARQSSGSVSAPVRSNTMGSSRSTIGSSSRSNSSMGSSSRSTSSMSSPSRGSSSMGSSSRGGSSNSGGGSRGMGHGR